MINPSQPSFDTTWVSRYGPPLRRYFSRRADPRDVDDLVQETMLRVQAISASSQVADIERYLFRTAHNVLIDQRRAEHTRRRAFDFVEAGGEADDRTPERIVIARDELERMRGIVLGLPERTRTAFLLRRFENLRYQEIADLMGISRNSVKDLMHRAIMAVTAELAKAETHDG